MIESLDHKEAFQCPLDTHVFIVLLELGSLNVIEFGSTTADTMEFGNALLMDTYSAWCSPLESVQTFKRPTHTHTHSQTSCNEFKDNSRTLCITETTTSGLTELKIHRSIVVFLYKTQDGAIFKPYYWDMLTIAYYKSVKFVFATYLWNLCDKMSILGIFQSIHCCHTNYRDILLYWFFFVFTPTPTIQVLLSHKHTRLSLISGLNGSTWQVQSVLPPPAAIQAFLRLPNSFILFLNKVLICFETLQSSPAAAPVAPRETQCGKSLFSPHRLWGQIQAPPPSLCRDRSVGGGGRKSPTLSGGPEMTQHHVPTPGFFPFRPHRTKLQEPALGRTRSCQ